MCLRILNYWEKFFRFVKFGYDCFWCVYLGVVYFWLNFGMVEKC